MSMTDEQPSHTSTGDHAPAPARPGTIDWPVFTLSGGFLVTFVVVALVDIDLAATLVFAGFDWAASWFGAFWQLLLFLTFVVAVALASSRYGRVRLGNLVRPEFSTFRWISMVLCTLLAGGGVFWAFAEPVAHFLTVPPMYPDVEPGTAGAIAPALAASFTDWGFLAWAILGTLGTIVLMYGHYHRGMPLRPRTLLYPLLGERVRHSALGTIIDVTAIVAVAAGTIGPIGFLGLQASFGLSALFGLPDTFVTQAAMIVVLMGIVMLSAATGLDKGIQLLSRFNVGLAAALGLTVLLASGGIFAIDAFVGGFGTYLQDFVSLQLYRGDTGWLSSWTVFFFGWFLGYGPMMAIFVARISRGRTIRELIVAVAVIAPIVTTVWFTIVGGAGIQLELDSPGIISGVEGGVFNLPAVMIAVTQALPGGVALAPLFLLLTLTFVATTGDSMSYTMAVAVSGDDTPRTGLRLVFAGLMGALAVLLIALGDGGVDALQAFIVVTAVPVGLYLLPPLWLAPKVAARLAREQDIVRTPARVFSPPTDTS